MLNNDVDEKLSLFVDGELDYSETLHLLKRVNSDENLKKRLLRYQAIGLTMQTEQYQPLRLDFSEAISQQIKQEPAYLLPVNKPATMPRRRLMAIAASTIAAAVLVGEAVRMNYTADQSNLTVAKVSPPKPAMVAANMGTAPDPAKPPKTAQFNDYLQAHNASIYTTGEANFRPYAKVASYK